MKLSVPVPLRILAVVVGTTAFYMYLGQIVPQKEEHPPPPVLISAEMTVDELVAVGAELAAGRGLCATCHNDVRAPSLDGIGSRAGSRIEGMSDVEYLAQSLYDPDAYLAPGYASGMQKMNEPPIGFSDDEMKAVVAWLQSQGGTATVTLDTDLGY